MDEAEEKIITAMATAACEADERVPERERGGYRWLQYKIDARRHYAMHKAMTKARMAWLLDDPKPLNDMNEALNTQQSNSREGE